MNRLLQERHQDLVVGNKIKKLLQKKKIEKISDLLLNFPQGYTDRSNLKTLDKLEVGKITTIKVRVKKYNFPRIRNLPNKVICEDERGKIDIVFFNSREGYIRKILPINAVVIISGKINFRTWYSFMRNLKNKKPKKIKYISFLIYKVSLKRFLINKFLNWLDNDENEDKLVKSESYIFFKRNN